jgi:hypothetical protein
MTKIIKIAMTALLSLTLVAAIATQVAAEPITAEQYRAVIGPCACPGDKTSNGHRCGRVSAYCRCGGWEPICFAGDDTGQREPNRQHRCGHICALYGK